MAEVKKKIITLGESQTGKTSLLFRLSEGSFNPYISHTVGTNFNLKKSERNGIKLLLQLHDTSSQEDYKSIAKLYFRNSDSVILIYDKNNRKSFNELGYWIGEINENIGPNVPVFLVASRCDLAGDDPVSYEDGKALCDKHGFKNFHEISALTGEGVSELFEDMLEELEDSIKQKTEEAIQLSLHSQARKKNKCKC